METTERLLAAEAVSEVDRLRAQFLVEGARAEWESARWERTRAELTTALTTGWRPALPFDF